MKKNRYDVEVLTKALNILNEYDHEVKSGTYTNLIVSDVCALMKRLSSYVDGMSPFEKQNKIDIFHVITEISFDKLEKDVMGVN